MKVRIEVVGENQQRAEDIVQDITCDLFDKYPKAEADLEKLERQKVVEFLFNN